MDNLGTMVCFHSRYTLGDANPKCSLWESLEELAMEADPELRERFDAFSEQLDAAGFRAAEWLERYSDLCREAIDNVLARHYLTLPLYLYEHSGLRMSTKPFSCRWDSCQVGYIYVSFDDIKKEYGVQELTPEVLEKAEAVLVAEVEEYDRYLDAC